MEILDVKYGGNFVFNKEKTNYHPKATQDQDGFKTATVEMKFKIKDIKASAWRSKANIHIHITDVDTGEDFTMTQKNIPALLFLVNNKIVSPVTWLFCAHTTGSLKSRKTESLSFL